MAGRHGTDGTTVWFVPRFGFVPGTSYTVVWRDHVAVLDQPACGGAPTTGAEAIYPSCATLPRNQLRLYVQFAAPMTEGVAARHVHVADAASGEPLVDALLETTVELWDRDRRRLTLLFDPGRIKRGLGPHQQLGDPLVPGRPIEVVVDAGFPDALGRPLVRPFSRRYTVGPDLRHHVDPASWVLHLPRASSVDPLVVDFDRPLDHGLVQRCLSVRTSGGAAVAGSAGIGAEERAWAFFPTLGWAGGAYLLEVDPSLEDLAGNSVARVFDRDLSDPLDDPRPTRPVRVPFVV
jgi:hypothetical protein